MSSIEKPIEELLKEYEDRILKVHNDEIALWKWKETYNIKADEIIKETDFKELYGANNQKVRDNHVRNELSDWYDTIKDLEFTINYNHNRIHFLRDLIRVKTTLMSVENE